MKAIILDRDGVINKCMPPHQYVTRPSEIEYLEKNIVLFSKIKKGIPIFIVTNQQGVGKGLMSTKELDAINYKILQHLEKFNIQIIKIYVCTHLESDNCKCRKPKPGMLLRIAQDYGVNLTDSLFVGDSESDIICATKAKCRSVHFGEMRIKCTPTYTAKNSTQLLEVLKLNAFIDGDNIII